MPLYLERSFYSLEIYLENRYEYSDHFFQLLRDQQFLTEENDLRAGVIDLNNLMYGLMGIIRQYRAILRLAQIRTGILL